MEKVILVGLHLPKTKRTEVEDSMAELIRLAETAGAEPAEIIVQQRAKPDPAYFIGKGKALELKEKALEKNIKTVVFDDDLKPGQQKNIEKLTNLKVVDRTRLILDIFAGRAHTKEGMLQVARAQLEYSLPRITERFGRFEQQTGGIGTRRGPGEKKLVVDQRIIRDRIAELDREIEVIRRHREVRRQKRAESGQSVVSIVGYTNAGKSTLLNTLSKSNEVYADDKYFATLDPTTRKVKLPRGRAILFTDTVGFINKLPHTLIAAFRATLEEITRSNCLLHLVDISQDDYEREEKIVLGVLRELDAGHIPVITVYNKADLLPPKRRRVLERKGNLLISARTGEGIEELLSRIEEIISPALCNHKITIPYSKTNLLSHIYRWAVVKGQHFSEKGIQVDFDSSSEYWNKIQALLGANPKPQTRNQK